MATFNIYYYLCRTKQQNTLIMKAEAKQKSLTTVEINSKIFKSNLTIECCMR